jgi:hypothetical protein
LEVTSYIIIIIIIIIILESRPFEWCFCPRFEVIVAGSEDATRGFLGCCGV